ncbi:hypothetical protein D3C81_820660 [compost metagenome]
MGRRWRSIRAKAVSRSVLATSTASPEVLDERASSSEILDKLLETRPACDEVTGTTTQITILAAYPYLCILLVSYKREQRLIELNQKQGPAPSFGARFKQFMSVT